MRITKYKTKLSETGLAYLVKDNAVNYPESKLDCSQKIVMMLNSVFDLKNETEEHVYLICFNNKIRLNGIFELSHGTVNASLVTPREVFQKALLCNASGIVIAHNHPSGDTTPSSCDREITDRIKSAGELMSIKLVDSIIVGTDYYSFKDNKLL